MTHNGNPPCPSQWHCPYLDRPQGSLSSPLAPRNAATGWRAAGGSLRLLRPYQTLVQTVTTDDAVRKGLNIDDYDMTWQQVSYGVGLLFGLFTGWGCRHESGPANTIAPGPRGVRPGQPALWGGGRARRPSSWAASSMASAR